MISIINKINFSWSINYEKLPVASQKFYHFTLIKCMQYTAMFGHLAEVTGSRFYY
jgi:hypothetical protein